MNTMYSGSMSEDEVAILVISSLLGVGLWLRWLWLLLGVARFAREFRPRRPLALAPFLCALALFVVLRVYAADDVRLDPRYLGFYLVMGMTWLALTGLFLPWFGLNMRDDAIERGNGVAGLAVAGAMVGLILCFAGANIGNGPGWWVVVFSALISSVAWFISWAILARSTELADRLSIDRDPAAGQRAAGFAVGSGLILGRAVAGDWVSAAATLMDFGRNGWPVLLLLTIAIFLEKQCSPQTDRDSTSLVTIGSIPALLYLGFSAMVLIALNR